MEIVVKPDGMEMVETEDARAMRFLEGANVVTIVVPIQQWDKFKTGIVTDGKLKPASPADLAGLGRMAIPGSRA